MAPMPPVRTRSQRRLLLSTTLEPWVRAWQHALSISTAGNSTGTASKVSLVLFFCSITGQIDVPKLSLPQNSIFHSQRPATSTMCIISMVSS